MNSHPILENEVVKLLPLSLENYHHLIAVASEENLVQYSPSHINSPEKLKNYVEIALRHLKENSAIPYIVYDKRTDRYAGCTRFMNIHWANKVAEIGATWIGREFQGSGLNGNMKSLMLTYAFEELNIEKIEFRIDERNVRSRGAVEKLGAKLEGVLRENVYLKDGFKRNTCCYGLLKREWEALLS